MKYILCIFLTLLCSSLHAQDAGTPSENHDAEETLYFINLQYHFRVEYPSAWSARKMEYPDPLPPVANFKTDKNRRNFAMNTKDVPNWNALFLTGDDAISDARIYAHTVPTQTFEDFMTNFKALLPLIEGGKAEIVSARQDATVDGNPAYEIIYTNDFGSKVTKTLLLISYKNGIRYGFTFWAFEKDFDKAHQHFKAFLDKFRILSDTTK